MTLLIDADWLIYSSCCACEQDIQWDTNLHTLHADERDVHEMIDGRVAHYQNIAEGDKDVVMCFTEYPTFRHTIYPEYKGTRKVKRRLNRNVDWGTAPQDEQQSMRQQMGRLIEYLEQLPLTLVSVDGIEADDTMAYISQQLLPKILGEAKTLEQMWEKVVAAYEKKKYNFADAVLNAQLARILRDGDFDFDTGEVSLWTP